jgi:alanine racemase
MLTQTYKHINIELVGHDGNAFSIMGRVTNEMRRDGCTKEEIEEVMAEMQSGDYNHLLPTVMDHFATDEEGEEEWCYSHNESLEECGCLDY